MGLHRETQSADQEPAIAATASTLQKITHIFRGLALCRPQAAFGPALQVVRDPDVKRIEKK